MEKFAELSLLSRIPGVVKLKQIFKKIKSKFHNKLQFRQLKSIKTKVGTRLLIGTKNGLYLIKEQVIYKLLPGEFYGISIFNENVFVFEKTGDSGRIIHFPLQFENGQKIKVFVNGLSQGCHQIDFVKDNLFITDTYNNSLLIYSNEGNKLKEVYPLGRLQNGRQSENYGHINSIYFHEGSYYLLCHNESKKTGKKSQVLQLDEGLKVMDVITLNASSAHNIMIYKDDYLVCDSLNNRLILGNKSVFNDAIFARGLSVIEEYIIVGGSEYAKREERKKASGALYILSKDFELIETIQFPAMVQEIRSLDQEDYTLSNCQKMAAV